MKGPPSQRGLAVSRAGAVPRTTSCCSPRAGADTTQPNHCSFPHQTEGFIFNAGCSKAPNPKMLTKNHKKKRPRKIAEQPYWACPVQAETLRGCLPPGLHGGAQMQTGEVNGGSTSWGTELKQWGWMWPTPGGLAGREGRSGLTLEKLQHFCEGRSAGAAKEPERLRRHDKNGQGGVLVARGGRAGAAPRG